MKMRTKEKRLVAAFYTTHDAMAFEDFCRSNGIAGRLIPLPREISAGCGLAWCAEDPDQEECLRADLQAAGITPQLIQTVII